MVSAVRLISYFVLDLPSRAILNDENKYGPDVATFNPERFLKDGELNPEVRYPDAAFGYGRRICPGRHLAGDSMFITFASVLATFDISRAVDENGNVITPTLFYSTGIIRFVPLVLGPIRHFT
jgi:cytochrome P450